MIIRLKSILLVTALLSGTRLTSQDFFEDINGSSSPILRGTDSYFLSARVNAGDNSLKLNIFKLTPLKDIPGYKTNLGWGLNLKGKIENGLGALFTGSEISPGFQVGGYLAYQYILKGANTKFGNVLLYSNYSNSNFQILDTSKKFKDQMYDTVFNGFNIGLSFVNLIPIKKTNFMLGGAVEIGNKNNYSSFDNVDIRTHKEIKDSVSGKTYSYNDINKNGYEYGIGKYNIFWETQIKIRCAWIPGNSNFALIPYGSVKFVTNKKENYSAGIGIHLLEEDNPGITKAGLTFEFSDIGNSKNSKEDFLKRSFKISLNASLNFFSK